MASRPIPVPDSTTGLLALRAMLRERHPLAALQVFNERLGNVFQVNLPGFKPVILVGPDAARYVLVSARGDLRWRNEADPVTKLLGHGVLVEDGEEHDRLRALMNPALHRSMLRTYVEAMVARTDQIISAWPDGGTVEMLVEMRRIALLILVDTLFGEDFTPELKRLWGSVLGVIRYISPGVWMIWNGAPRPGYGRAIRQMDDYLYRMIAARRRSLAGSDPPADLLGTLIAAGLDDALIRDQLLTMLIAGHDTSTALLAWAAYLLGAHPDALAKARTEVDACLGDRPPTFEDTGQLVYLGNVIREALRLYPPIHLGSRVAAVDLSYDGYAIPAGARVVYSIYLTQRHPDYWPDPHTFHPDRFAGGEREAPYTWLALGGGPRSCIGGAFGQVESKVILARLLQRYDVTLKGRPVHPHMGATLEPRPGVRMRVARR